MKKIVLMAAMALAGCTSGGTEFTGPSGQKVSQAKCSVSPQGCFQKASDTCKGSYQVLDSHSKSGGIAADLIPGPVTWYSMTYQCGPSDGRMPQFPFRGPGYVVPVAPAPVQPTTTNCSRYGNQVTCRTY